MTNTHAAHRPDAGHGLFSAFHAVLRSFCAGEPTDGAARDRAEPDGDAARSLWEAAADRNAAFKSTRLRRKPRGKAVEIDPQALARAERMVASIHARSVIG